MANRFQTVANLIGFKAITERNKIMLLISDYSSRTFEDQLHQ